MAAARRGAKAPALGALLVWLAAGFVPSRAEPAPLAGTVRDTLGNVLAGVEILLVRMPSPSFAPAATVRSDETGRFQIERLVPGRYRLAALKRGYQTFVGRIDTLRQESIDLVLRPGLAVGDRPLPEDASWALRLPRRGMLHDVEPLPVPRTDGDQRTASPSLDDRLTMELEQYFSVHAVASQDSPEPARPRPSETKMTLTSALGERGNILVEGWSERLRAGGSGERPQGRANQDGAALNVDLSYATSPDARLAVNAFFLQNDYAVAADGPAAPAALRQEQQTWGYDARWSKQLDPASRLAVAVDYQDTWLAGAVDSTEPLPATATRLGALANRAVGAHGTYRSAMSERHDVEVALRTRLHWPSMAAPELPRAAAEDGTTWTVQADAQDTWSLASPFSLVCGLGYKQAMMAREAKLLVPRVGGSVAGGGWFARAQLSYHRLADVPDPSSAGYGYLPLRPADPLGYEAEIEVPVAREVRVRGGVSYTPIQFDHLGYVHGADLEEHPLYLTDGNSAVREQRLVVVEQRGASRAYLELSDGRAEGTVAPLLPFEGALPLAERRLRYRNGRLGVMFPSQGTDLRVEYRRVEASGTGEGRDRTDAVQESVELRVKTDVPVRQVPGDWRVLLALRLGTVRSGEIEARSSRAGVEPVDALNRRISAGVAVLF